MKPAPFQYHAPRTIDEALDLLAEYGDDDGRIIAGGQSLVPTMAFRLAKPRHLVDINGVSELNYLEIKGGQIHIGAGVRHSAFEKPVDNGPLGRLLSEVVKHIAHHPIRTRGTFCGSIAHADPASEWCAVVAALDGDMLCESKRSGGGPGAGPAGV
jgi:carbon-monoxide dehydrogenase medium subunit